jgi:hypothetical protein
VADKAPLIGQGLQQQQPVPVARAGGIALHRRDAAAGAVVGYLDPEPARNLGDKHRDRPADPA